MAQTILSNKQSTSGSPYVIYTVNVTPSNRTLTTVDLTVQITAHLKNADSSLGTGSGYGIKGKLTVAGQDKWFDGASGNGPIIKGTSSSWSGTGNHTTAAYTYTITGLSWSTTSLAASFYAIRTSGNTSNAGYLKTTDCTAITIDRAAAPSSIQEIVGGGGTTDYTPTVKWTPYDSSFKFKVKYSYGSWGGYTSDYISPNTTNQFPYSGYTITGASVAPYMSASSGTFTATLYTYDSGGNYIGESSANFTVTLNANTYKPTASVGTFSEAGGIVPSGWGIFVQGKSKLSFTVSASASTGSSISGYSTSVNGATYTQTNITTDWLSSSGSANLTVTDSRGRTGTASSGYTVVAYATPDIDLTGYRAGSSGTADGNGQYYHYIISGHIQSCKNGSTEKNSVSEIKIGYRVAGSSSAFSYETISATMGSTSNNRVAFTAEGTVFGGNLSTANNYEIRAYLKDGLGIESYDTESVGAAFKLLSYTADGTGIAIGKKATVSNKVEINMDVDVNNSLNVDGNETVGGTLTSTGEMRGGLGYGQFRAAQGNYGFFIRNDGSNTYFMLTNSGDAYGSWNGLRPITVQNGDGKVHFGNGVQIDSDTNLVLDGGRIEKNAGTWWIGGRDEAIIKNTRNDGGSWNPVTDNITPNGDIATGTLGDNWFIQWTPNSNYSGGSNVNNNLQIDLTDGYYCKFYTTKNEFAFYKRVVANDFYSWGNVYANGRETLTDEGWVDCWSVASGLTCRVRRRGNLVYLRVTGSISNGSTGQKATIPDGYRPNDTYHFYGCIGGKRISRWWANAAGGIGFDWAINISNAGDYSSTDWVETNAWWFIN